MRVASILATVLPLALAETSLYTSSLCYASYNDALGKSTVTETAAPTTKYRTETHAITYQPVEFLDKRGAVTGSGTTTVTNEYTSTVPAPAGFTPVKKSKHFSNAKLQRRQQIVPKTPRKQQRRHTPNHVVCSEQVEHVEYIRHETSATATATIAAAQQAVHTLEQRQDSDLNGTFTAPAHTYYAACGASNTLHTINSQKISYMNSFYVTVKTPDAYSCCVACQEEIGHRRCGGYAFNANGKYDGGAGRNCRLIGASDPGVSGSSGSHPEHCDEETVAWTVYTGYSSVWSGPFEIGNGPCAQVQYGGAAPSVDS